MTIQEVKQIIEDSQFKAGLKKRLVLLLPRLGKYTLLGLGKEVSRGDSLLISGYLTSLWENFANLLDGFKNKDENSFKKLSNFLNENLSKHNGEDELYILYFVLDLRPLVNAEKARFMTEQYQKLIDFEISLFWELPEEEMVFFLQNQLLFLESQVNLLEYIKVATWENEWDYRNDFNKNFSDLLLKNKEKLGSKTVGAWVEDYFNFSSPSSFRADVVQVAEFLIKDPSVQKLSEQERKTLSEILKLYVWFLKPEMNEDEILAYKEEIRQRQAEIAEQVILKEIELSNAEQNYQGTKPSPPAVPAPKDLPSKKPMEEVVSPRIKNQESRIKEDTTSPPPPVSVASMGIGSATGQASLRPPQHQSEARYGAQQGGGSKDRKMDLEDTDARPGLKMWNSTPPQMPKQPAANNKVMEISAAEVVVEDSTAGTSAKIDKKLEELEKRVKN